MTSVPLAISVTVVTAATVAANARATPSNSRAFFTAEHADDRSAGTGPHGVGLMLSPGKQGSDFFEVLAHGADEVCDRFRGGRVDGEGVQRTSMTLKHGNNTGRPIRGEKWLLQ
mmetsp:Transcript_10155/g.28979  ORF Transcript_10155/g.28979 Transcript_10155/m.28979 type:complete len:114 (-) Transcript_10155:479-820(-)